MLVTALLAIFAVVTLASAIVAVVTLRAMMLLVDTEFAAILALVTADAASFDVVTLPSRMLTVLTASLASLGCSNIGVGDLRRESHAPVPIVKAVDTLADPSKAASGPPGHVPRCRDRLRATVSAAAVTAAPVVLPVPPWPVASGVGNPVIEVMSLFAALCARVTRWRRTGWN